MLFCGVFRSKKEQAKYEVHRKRSKVKIEEGVSKLPNAIKSPEIIRRGGTRAFSNIQFSEAYF